MKCWGIDMDDIIRIGQVSEVNESEHMVRVHFADVDIVSGWLKVIRSPPFIPKKGVAQETETADLHKHEIKIAILVTQYFAYIIPDLTKTGM